MKRWLLFLACVLAGTVSMISAANAVYLDGSQPATFSYNIPDEFLPPYPAFSYSIHFATAYSDISNTFQMIFFDDLGGPSIGGLSGSFASNVIMMGSGGPLIPSMSDTVGYLTLEALAGHFEVTALQIGVWNEGYEGFSGWIEAQLLSTTTVPEPLSILIFASGLLGLGLLRRQV
jgi:hypothetical protein